MADTGRLTPEERNEFKAKWERHWKGSSAEVRIERYSEPAGEPAGEMVITPQFMEALGQALRHVDQMVNGDPSKEKPTGVIQCHVVQST